MARVVTVHLVIPDEKLVHADADYAADIVADYVSEFLGEAEHNGVLFDWGYAEGGFPDFARIVNEENYQEGDFYCRSGLRPYLPGVLVKE